MLPAPRGRAGAKFLILTFAVRTMAGGTSRGDVGASLGQHVAFGAHRALSVEVGRVGKCPADGASCVQGFVLL